MFVAYLVANLAFLEVTMANRALVVLLAYWEVVVEVIPFHQVVVNRVPVANLVLAANPVPVANPVPAANLVPVANLVLVARQAPILVVANLVRSYHLPALWPSPPVVVPEWGPHPPWGPQALHRAGHWKAKRS